jgi:hypothetical protein
VFKIDIYRKGRILIREETDSKILKIRSSLPAKISYPRAKISVKNTKSRRVEELNLTIFIITRLQKSVHHPINNKEQLSGLEQQQQLSTHRAGATAAAVHIHGWSNISSCPYTGLEKQQQLSIHRAGPTAAAVHT